MAWFGERAAANWYWLSSAAFVAFAVVESLKPDHRVRSRVGSRWLGHMAVYAVGIVTTSTVLPVFFATMAIGRPYTEATGLFRPVEAAGGPWAVLAAGLLSIDLLLYWVHRLEHRFEILWRFHAVHHADPDLDVSTALLHHPVITLFTGALVGGTMITLGLPAWVLPVYALFEITVGAFQHVATPISDGFERRVRWLFVTPGMHQAHHSADPAHHDTNYANVLSVWDRLFGTFLALDASERAQIRFGIAPDGAGHGLAGILTRPFRISRRADCSGKTGTAQPVQQA